MKRILICTLMLFAFSPAALVCAETQSVSVVSDRYGAEADFVLPSYELEEIAHSDGSVYQRIRVEGWGRTRDKGLPELPLTGIMVEGPQSGAIHLKIQESSYETLPGMNIYPVPELVMSEETVQTEFCRDEEAYAKDAFFPGPIVEVANRGTLRDTSLAFIRIHPFQWNPSTGELRVCKRIRFQAVFEEPLSSATRSRQGQFDIRDVFEWTPAPDGNERRSTRAAGEDAIRIGIESDGIFRVAYEDLASAGIDPSGIDHSLYQLFNGQTEIALNVVSGSSGPLSEGDYFEFYGQGVDNQYTGTNVYMLRWGSSAGKRMAEENAEDGSAGEIDSFHDVISEEVNKELWANTPGAPDVDYWFWEKIDAPKTGTYNLTIPFPATSQDGAEVRVTYQGRSTAPPEDPNVHNHHTLVYVNDTLVSDDDNSYWDDDDVYVQEMPLTSNPFVNGDNTVNVYAPGDTGAAIDTIYLNRIEIECDRLLKAVDDELAFSVDGSGLVGLTIKNFSSNQIRIWDVTDPGNAKELTGFDVQADDTTWQAAFEVELSGERSFHAFAESRVASSDKIEKIELGILMSPDNRADYILITDSEFVSETAPLVQYRQGQGMRTFVAGMDEVYNEFSYGLVDPAAIRDFLQYAFDNWRSPAPLYVFLLGDANTDIRDYEGGGKKSRVPPHMIFTTGVGLTPEDNWYVCVQGDDSFPDMLVGRAPANSAQKAAQIVQKILDYESSVFDPKNALFVADDDPQFENQNEIIIEHLLPDFQAVRVYQRTYGSGSKQAIIDALNDGMMMTNYSGHGSVKNWTNMFYSSDIASLSNAGRLSFVTMMTCINGYYSHPDYYCMAEQFMAEVDKGAVGTFAPSVLGYLWEQNILADEFYANVYQREIGEIGAVAADAKIRAFDRGISELSVSVYTLFGDPATKLKILPGDLNVDGVVDLADVQIQLQISTGQSPSDFHRLADVDSDDRVGAQEGVHGLREALDQ